MELLHAMKCLISSDFLNQTQFNIVKCVITDICSIHDCLAVFGVGDTLTSCNSAVIA